MPDPARFTDADLRGFLESDFLPDERDIMLVVEMALDYSARLAAAENVVEAARLYRQVFISGEEMDAVLAAYDAQKGKP